MLSQATRFDTLIKFSILFYSILFSVYSILFYSILGALGKYKSSCCVNLAERVCCRMKTNMEFEKALCECLHESAFAVLTSLTCISKHGLRVNRTHLMKQQTGSEI